MYSIYSLIMYLLGGGLLLIGVLLVVRPHEQIDKEKAYFDASSIGDDIDVYLAKTEAEAEQHSEKPIINGVKKHIIWAGERGRKTFYSVVYIHGYSATLQESRPVADRIAKSLGANLFFTRLAGHGIDGAELARVNAGDWIRDVKEAIVIGERIGEKIILISMSTGGTLVTAVLADTKLSSSVIGTVFMSPNFKIKDRSAVLLGLPLARYWTRFFSTKNKPVNDEYGKYWIYNYPIRALLPVKVIVDYAAKKIDYGKIKVPALFIFSNDDGVVSPQVTKRVVQRWGGEKEVSMRTMTEVDHRFSHIIAGDIVSPNQTDSVVKLILQWVSTINKK